MAGKATDKLAVTVIRDIVCNIDGKVTKEECGKIVKRAFPGVCRRSCNSKWFYYGLQHIDGKETPSSHQRKNPLNNHMKMQFSPHAIQTIQSTTKMHQDQRVGIQVYHKPKTNSQV